MRRSARDPGPASLRRADGFRRPHCLLLLSAAVLMLIAIALGGCLNRQSYEMASNGSLVYLDQLSEPAKAAARQRIVQSLNRGIGVYDLGIGDENEIFFHVRSRPTARKYTISVADELRIDFLGDTQNSQTVLVSPDGKISLPLIGSVVAIGQTPDALARQLERRYSLFVTKPEITVNVTVAHSLLEDFLKTVGSSTKGRSIIDKVLPDGTLLLPLLPPVKALGRPLKELEREVDAAYAAKGLDVFVSIVPRTLHSNTTLVVGEVGTPGQIELKQPTTVLMAVAQAGGVLKTGSMEAVRIYYTDKDGVQRLRSINLDDVIGNLATEQDMIVPPNSIIYVPPTELARAGRLVDTTLHDVLQFQGLSIGAGFPIFPPSNNSSVTIFQTAPSK